MAHPRLPGHMCLRRWSWTLRVAGRRWRRRRGLLTRLQLGGRARHGVWGVDIQIAIRGLWRTLTEGDVGPLRLASGLGMEFEGSRRGNLAIVFCYVT